MTSDGTEYLVRCWAYNKAGQRCAQLAGHDGNHAIVSEWTDEECFVPGEEMILAAPTSDIVGGLLQVGATAPVHIPRGVCVICGHKMHESMCSGTDENDMPCGCSTGIEE